MYSPCNVNDPSQPNHSVIIHPGQTTRVRLSYATVFNDIDAAIKSDFLELEEEFFQRGGKTFVFRQKFDLESWSKISTTFLGEVSFHQDENQEHLPNINMPNLCFFLESDNHFKKDVITAVNPHGGQTVKVYPHQILEVVVFNPIWGQELTWKYEPEGDNRMQLLANCVIDPTTYKLEECRKTINDAFFTYPRMVQKACQAYQEYHFWFRCNPTVAKVIKLFDDQYPAGELVFTGLVDGKVRAEHRIGVKLNDRQIPKPPKSRSEVVTFEDSAMDKGQKSDFLMPPLRPIDTWKSRLARHAVKAVGGREIVPVTPADMSIDTVFGYDGYDPNVDYYETHFNGKMTKAERRAAKQAARREIMGCPVQMEKPKHQHHGSGSNTGSYVYRKPMERRIVIVTMKNFDSLEDGCKVLEHDDLPGILVDAELPKGISNVLALSSPKAVGTEPDVLQKIYEEMQAWD